MISFRLHRPVVCRAGAVGPRLGAAGVVLSLVLGLILAAMGCRSDPSPKLAEQAPGSDQPTPEAPSASKSYVWSNVEPLSLDPPKAKDMAAHKILYNLFEGLMTLPAGDGDPIPGVAKAAPEVDEAQTKWTFHLRRDAVWSDGRAVTAHDFVYAWRRAIDPATAASDAESLRPLVNGEDILAGRAEVSSLGVEALDDHTLEVRLAHPVPLFAKVVSQPPFFPVRRDVVEAHKDRWTHPENIVGNGAFLLAEWKPRDRIELVRNPRYRDADSVQLERSTVLHVEDSEVAWQMYKTGKLHRLYPVPAPRIRRLIEDANPELHIDTTLCTGLVVINMQRAPLNDARVRQALSMSLDRKRLVQHLLARGDKVAHHLFPPTLQSLQGYASPQGSNFDPKRASELLALAGYPGGRGFPRLTYLYNTHGTNKTVAEFIRSSSRDHLHIPMEIENLEWKTFLSRLNDADFDLARMSFCGIEDPLEWAEIFRSSSPVNYGRFSDESFDALLDAAAKIRDKRVRNTTVATAEKRVLDDQVVIPLYFGVTPYLLKPEVRGFEAQSSDIHLLRYISLASRVGEDD